MQTFIRVSSTYSSVSSLLGRALQILRVYTNFKGNIIHLADRSGL